MTSRELLEQLARNAPLASQIGTRRVLVRVVLNQHAEAHVAIEEPAERVPMPRRWWQFWKRGRTLLTHGIVEITVMTKYVIPDWAKQYLLHALEDSVAAGITLRLRFLREES